VIILAEAEPTKKEVELEQIIVRSYPKAIILLPTGILAILFGIIEAIFGESNWLGLFFLAVFLFNIFILSFEFSEAKTFGFFAIIVILILLYILAGQMGWISSGSFLGFIGALDTRLSEDTFFVIGMGILFVVFLIWLSRRWDYWIIEPNQITHKKGIFGGMDRYPTAGLKYSIDISDVFEHLLFKSGKLTIYFPQEKLMIPLTLVPNIKKVEHQIRQLLGIVEIEVEE